jgi:RNA polymerase sigma-70 factor (ECF subfamily)
MPQTFHSLLLTQLPRLRAYAFTLTRNRADADDLLQSTAVLVLRSEAMFIAGSNFPAWTYRIMRNSFLSGCRKNKRRPVSIDTVPEAALALPETLHDHILSREVVRAMTRLSPVLREVLALICGAELSYEEAAVVLGCSTGTVKSRLWRARDRLKNLLLIDSGADAQSVLEIAERSPAADVPPALQIAS